MAARSKADRAGENLCRPHAGAEADQAAAGFLNLHRHQLRRCGEADLTVTTLASDSGDGAVAERKASRMATWWPRLRPLLLAVAFPAAMLAIWHFATIGRPGSLIPPPYEVWLELWDLAFGGINDDAYSQTLHIHLLASVSRVYGGFALALIVALPLGMLIGRVPLVRQLLDPTIQILRPVPVTAWLPLAMIIFGLGPRSAFFLVFVGAFYPILVNTLLGMRSVDPRLFEAASMHGCRGPAPDFRVVVHSALPP